MSHVIGGSGAVLPFVGLFRWPARGGLIPTGMSPPLSFIGSLKAEGAGGGIRCAAEDPTRWVACRTPSGRDLKGPSRLGFTARDNSCRVHDVCPALSCLRKRKAACTVRGS